MTTVAIVYATLGRPQVVGAALSHLLRQTRRPDVVVVSAVTQGDVEGLADSPSHPELLFGPKGLCLQRNRAMAHLAGRADLVVFFDDDYFPADDFVAQAIALFETHPDLAGATGRMIADGIKTPGISFQDALQQIEQDEPPAAPVDAWLTGGLYGCNMVIRASKADGLWFDEKMPLYGWLEDLDFTHRLSARGGLMWTQRLAGVHLGVKGGRTSGVKLGYSQIANPIYMLRKRSAPRAHVVSLMLRNVASNLVLSVASEPYVDRPGRLRGNLLALRDLLVWRLDPMRILTLE